MTPLRTLLSGLLLLGGLFLAVPQAPPLPPGEVPIGTILSWWGDPKELPRGYELCDGTVVKTLDAVLRGRKPDLQSRFLRGAPDPRSFVPLAFAGGGLDENALGNVPVNVVIADHAFALTPAQLRAHTHTVPARPHRIVDISGNPVTPAQPASLQQDHPVAVPQLVAGNDNTAGGGGAYVQSFTQTQAATAQWPANGGRIEDHPAAPTGATGGGQQVVLQHQVTPLKLTLPRLDNRPPFLDVLYHTRVK
jgi:hypothetical protein